MNARATSSLEDQANHLASMVAPSGAEPDTHMDNSEKQLPKHEHAPKPALDAKRMGKILDSRRFNLHKPPAKLPALFKLAGVHTIATRGNLEAIQAQSKAGKTAFISAMIAAWLKPGEEFLAITADKNAEGAVVHFDSEQPEADAWDACATAARRAGVTQNPKHLRSFCLSDLDAWDRRQLVRFELQRARDESGSIYAVFLDGVGDLCRDANSTDEAFGLISELHRLAIEFNTAIFCVLHENEGSDGSKMRGHLGSELTRKAESNLRLQKDQNNVTTVWTEKARHCQIAKKDGTRFHFDEALKMHVPFRKVVEVREEQKLASVRTLFAGIFANAPSGRMRRCEMMEAMIGMGIAKGTARERFDSATKGQIIRKTDGDDYQMAA